MNTLKVLSSLFVVIGIGFSQVVHATSVCSVVVANTYNSCGGGAIIRLGCGPTDQWAVTKDGTIVTGVYDDIVDAIRDAHIPGCVYRGPSAQKILDERKREQEQRPVLPF